MARKLISIRGGISIAPAFLAATTLLWIASAKTIGSTAKDTPQWDDKASKELMAALHHTHEEANAGDMKAVKQSYIGDDALVSFELDPANATPVALRSKKEIDAHFDRVSAGISAEGTLNLDGPKMNCRATATFGVCSEECTIRLTKADGTEQVDHFFGSGTAVKIGGEWISTECGWTTVRSARLPLALPGITNPTLLLINHGLPFRGQRKDHPGFSCYPPLVEGLNS